MNMETIPPDFATLRQQMVADIAARGVENKAILRAMLAVPREQFVPTAYRDQAYRDGPLPIPEGQTISQPYVVALMLDLLAVQPTDKVLEVGTGSGYAAAVLGELAAVVHTVERHPPLVAAATERLAALGYGQVHVHLADGTLGWLDAAPYDAIVVAAGGPKVPPALLEQLAVGGRLVMPVGKKQRRQRLVRVVRAKNGRFRRQQLGAVAFVPLIGDEGWAADDR